MFHFGNLVAPGVPPMAMMPMPLEELLAILDGSIRPLSSEVVDWSTSYGRVLANDLVATRPLPSFPRAAMDGYAVRATDIVAATPNSPVELILAGTSWTARPYLDVVQPFKAVRITTGAPMPMGADVVLMHEEVALSADGSKICVTKPRAVGHNVIQIGEDVPAGQVVLQAGRRLRPQDVALAVGLGYSRLEVVRSPRVAIVATGSEVLPPGSTPRDHCIVDTNTPLLMGLIHRDGGTLVTVNRVGDAAAELEGILRELTAQPLDILLIVGGTSRGEEDHVPAVVARFGRLIARGVAIKPGAPVCVAWLNATPPGCVIPAVLLPGNPVACLVAYDLIAGRVVRRLAGLPWELPYPCRTLPLADELRSTPGRWEYVRVTLRDGQAVPLRRRGASALSTTIEADGFALLPPGETVFPKGSCIKVWFYDLSAAD